MSHGPMEQFKIHKLFEINCFGFDISLTNSGVTALAIFSAIGIFFILATRKKNLIPGKMQIIAEGFYNFTMNIVGNNISGDPTKYMPVVFSIFMSVLTCNIFGMFPYSFTVTSHIAVTMVFACFVFFSVIIFGVSKNGLKYFAHFIPMDLPKVIIPLMVVIELFSFLVRPLTLSVRLAANMTAGHIVLKVIAAFVVPMALFGVVPVLFLSALTAFEIFISLLQAYIFSLLTCIYINEAVSIH